VLDVAAGHGRHARFFAQRGAQVVAVDRSRDALDDLRGVDGVSVEVADLEDGDWPFAGVRFDAVVVVNYLHRALLPRLRAAMAPRGLLVNETVAQGNEGFGRPRNPDFLLEPGELLRLAALPPALTVVAFEQGRVQHDGGSAVVQRLAALDPGRAWPPPLDPPPGEAG
jgi:SAM-dependent methyltransferase